MCCWSVPVFSWFAASVMKYYKLEGETVVEFLCSFSFWWCVKSWQNCVLMQTSTWTRKCELFTTYYSCVDCYPDLRLSHFLDYSKSACKIVGFIIYFVGLVMYDLWNLIAWFVFYTGQLTSSGYVHWSF